MPSARTQIILRPLDGEDAAWRDAARESGDSLNAWLRAAANAALENPGIPKVREPRESRKSESPEPPKSRESGPPATPKVRESRDPEPPEIRGCWDHRESPKSWCQGCQAERRK